MASIEDLEEVCSWLSKFCCENPEKYESEETPLRIIEYYVSQQELSGACMNWASAYLRKL